MDAYQPQRFALTGSTGALGFAFLRRLFEHDRKVEARLLVRQSSPSFQSEAFQFWLQSHRERITLIEGDVRQLERPQLDALLETDGGLWHFAAVTSLTSANEQVAREIHEVNVEGTRRLAAAARRLGAGGLFFHVSTAYVAGQRGGTIREDESRMEQAFRNPYEASKLAAETQVQEAFASGVRGAIFRPSVVVDNRGGTGGFKMFDACAYAVALAVKRNEPFVFRLPATASINLVHSDWVIAAMADLARLPSGPGITYHLTAPRPTYLRDIAAILERLVPGLKLGFEPEWKRAELPTASKIFDKAITEIRPYFGAGVLFDRSHTERDLSPDVRESPLDLELFVRRRLESELGQMAGRK